MNIIIPLLFFIATTGCSSAYDNFYMEKNQINKYFLVDRKNVDNLTSATILSLRDVSNANKIPEYLGSLCEDYPWMNSKRVLHIFESPQYSRLFDSFGVENIKKNKPVGKYIASYNPDEESVTFFPLLREKRRKIYMEKGWCLTRRKGVP